MFLEILLWIKWQLCAFDGWNCENWTGMDGMGYIKERLTSIPRANFSRKVFQVCMYHNGCYKHIHGQTYRNKIKQHKLITWKN